MSSFKSQANKAGMAPGTLVYIGSEEKSSTNITVTQYNEHLCDSKIAESVNDAILGRDQDSILWIDIEGLSVSLIKEIGQTLNIHSLVLEDILNTNQRSKYEEHNDYLYIVLKHAKHTNLPFTVEYEQVSILVFEKLVITFKEEKNSLFEPLNVRLNNSQSRFRQTGADYLAYAIIDIIVDTNFVLLDSLDELSNKIEDELMKGTSDNTLFCIQQAKRGLVTLRKTITPLREIVTSIMRSDSKLIQQDNHIYFRDIYDHAIHIVEEIDSFRDIFTGLLDIYKSNISNKMNEIMKILTIFASIFIPMTFIAGVYGMNFKFMPELESSWGYPAVWTFFILFSILSVWFYRRKKWL